MTGHEQSVEAVVEVSGLVVAYDGRRVVDGVRFDVRRGEVFALLGPNGAGKTTTVEVLSGHRGRQAGEVRVLGQDPASAPRAWRDRIGVVSQSAADHEFWRVGEVLAQFARYYADPLEPARALALTGLADLADRRVGVLSGGQRRRLDIALGILGTPALLFLDEPTTGLDPDVRRGIWDLVQALAADGTSVLLTSHYLDEVDHLADRVAVLNGGRIQQVCAPDALGADAPTEVRWRENGERRTAAVPDAMAFLAELQHRLGPEVPELEIRRPSLEDRYLRVLGTDAAPAGAAVPHATETGSL
ncbi:ABC transporter ATP-binding protein [Streptomyces sp. NPDC058299]|uniref:ABC transporter ATP-binding protein n=1 Tax=Streptomyces sp. NPDC058299 TaxID=3346435 RepID=UPI0036F07178